MEITFRKVSPDDFEFILALISVNLREVISKSFNGNMNYALYLERIKKEGSANIVLCDKRPCGLIWYSINGVCLHINTIVIDSAYQNLGIGSRIFENLEEIARALKLRYMHLGVQGVNKRAIKFYEKRGFIKVSYVKNVDTFYMQKNLY